MFHIIDEVLNAQELADIHTELQHIQFDDGKKTAGMVAKTVKNNVQAQGFDKTAAIKLIRKNLQNNEKFRQCALPMRMSSLMLSKYQPGMEYGYHSDSPIIELGRIRADIAFTLFLTDPAQYDGGELEIKIGDQVAGNLQHSYKLPAGSMLLYPAVFVHCVIPVTSGERIAVVGWVQSMVRDHHKRGILRDLSVAQEALLRSQGKSPTVDGMNNALSNLLRLWAEN